MIIRATTKEELREVLNYMCAQLRQTRVEWICHVWGLPSIRGTIR